MARAKKTTTTTKAVAKKAAAVEAVATEVVVEEKPVAAAPVKATKVKHASDDAFLCRSVCQGELVYQSKKSGILYVWANYGDEIQLEYQDLLPLILTKSDFVMKPLFIIEDAEFVAEYPDLEKVYIKALGYDNIDAILNLDSEGFRKKLLEAPMGIRDSIKTAVATRVEEGTFDSLQKIKIVDQILGSDLMCLLNG